jgi:DNA-binding GntR family transcriptional regulator
VEAIPRRGFYVRLFSKEEMISIFELREVLEGLAARRAANNISDSQIKKLREFFKLFQKSTDITDIKGYATEDRRFHNFVTGIGAKEFLKSILENYNIISYSYQLVSLEGLVRPPNITIHEHRAIIDAISDRDADSAEDLMRQHLKRGIAILRQEIETERQTMAKTA